MTDINKIRYRAVIEFLTLENVLPQQIHNRMTVVYGECAPSYATVNGVGMYVLPYGQNQLGKIG